MKSRTEARLTGRAAEEQLNTFVGKFEPALQAFIRKARRIVRGLLPTAHELVYDNYNFLVIGYSPTERPSDAIVSLAADANGVRLCFLQGSSLRDPEQTLLGSGSRNRYVRLDSADALTLPSISTLLQQAVKQASVPLPNVGSRKLIIRSVSDKQRSRRAGGA